MYTLGIDFGTTNSCVSYINDQKTPIIILNPEGQYTTPSCIYFNKKDILIGSSAYSLVIQNNKDTISQNLIYNFKRLFGIKYDNYIKNDKLVDFFCKRGNVIVKDKETKLCAFEIVDLENSTTKIISVTDIVKLYLEYLINISRYQIDFDINDVVITVPTYFNDFQRGLLKSIYTSINLNVIRIVNEPTAAALAYNKNERFLNKESYSVLVIDCGGGTTDTSIVCIDNEELNEFNSPSDSFFQVISVNGDNFLGGEDITNMLFDYSRNYWLTSVKDSELTQKQKIRLFNECEMAKRNLSYNMNTTLFFNDSIIKQLSRSEFYEIVKPFFYKINKLINDTIEFRNVDKVVFVGGTTRMPFFVDIVHSILGNTICIHNTLDPDQTISIGASYYGYTLQLNKYNDNDEIDGTLTVIDILPMSIGVETVGGFMTPIVSKNSQLPISKSKIFTNSEDNIDEMKIEIFQGERRFVRDNHKLGELLLNGLDNSLKRGEMNIKVSIDIDVNGIISVKATDLKKDNVIISCVLDYTNKLETNITDDCIDINVSDDSSSEDDLLFDSIRTNIMNEILEFSNTLHFAKKSFKDIEEKYKIKNKVQIQQLFDEMELFINKCNGQIFEKEYITAQEVKDTHIKFKNKWHELMTM